MKKLLIVFLVLVLIAGGLFLWKGGHHAIFLAQAVEEWLDADAADQSMTLQIQKPDFRADDAGNLQPQVRQWTLSADTFWMELNDRTLFGLTAQGVTAYTDGKILYLDTGKAYSLPDMTGLHETARKMAFGLLLNGRVTKDGDTYRVTMDTDELELHAVLTADRTIRTGTVTAVLPDETAVTVSMETKPPISHPIPEPVLDSMVRAKMEPPLPLTEPLEFLIPAFRNLLPLRGDLTLGVECGILNLSETAEMRMDGEKVLLERKGVTAELRLPDELSEVDPAALSLLLLRNGSFTHEGSTGRFDLSLTAELTNSLCTSLVPRLSDLGITFTESHAALTITDGRLTSVTMTASGEVPFLITTIPVSFRAALQIHD